MVELTPADLTDAPAFVAALRRELAGLVTSTDSGDWYIFYDPDRITVPDNRFPFLTVMTGDRYDAASRLDRDAATYRVNVGVGTAPYEALLGPAPRQPAGYEVIDTGADYTAEDVVLPHPFYAPLHWVCVVNPGETTRARLGELVGTAYALAERQYAGRRPD